MRGCCKNCKSHKDETNAEAAIGLFWVFLWFCHRGSFRVLGFKGLRVLRALGGLGLYGIRVFEI